MPKTKFQEFIFTLIASGCMIFIMGVYNVAICTGGLQAATFKHALHSFPLEWFIRNHFKPDFYLAPDHLSKFHYGLPTADLSCWSVLPLHIPSPVRLHQPRK